VVVLLSAIQFRVPRKNKMKLLFLLFTWQAWMDNAADEAGTDLKTIQTNRMSGKIPKDWRNTVTSVLWKSKKTRVWKSTPVRHCRMGIQTKSDLAGADSLLDITQI